MEDDRSVEACQRSRGLRIGVSVVDDDRLAELAGELELDREQAPLPVVRCPVAVEVEAGLAHGHGALVPEELRQLGQPLRLRPTCLMRMDSERGENPAFAFGDRERSPAGIDARADRNHALDAGLTGAGEQRLRRLLAPVEVRVGVDHATAVSSSTRGNSGSAGSIPSAATVQP